MTSDEGGGVGVGVGENYEVRLKGRLDARWAAWFDGLGLTHEGAGTTVMHGPVADQAALHGLLSKVRDLGLPLVSTTRVGPAGSDATTIEPHEVLTNLRKAQEQ
ncbi:MAG TPA: hypothetical protein VFA49_09370 [Chloroflexota bacterium]|jgi:hypothetical protein|nr:hypothetical protein [Chloroflexota bacterium]